MEKGVVNRNGVYWLDYRVNGRRKRRKIGSSKKLAETIMRKIRVEIAECKYLDIREEKTISFQEFADIYVESYAKKKRSWPTTDVHYLKRLLPFFGSRPLNEISPLMVERYQTERRNQKTYKGSSTSVAYVNRELACLKCMFSHAIEWGYAKDNPVKKVKFEKENNSRVRFLENEELKKLIDCSDKALKPAIILAVNTGMRLNEIQDLTWQDIDLRRSFITLRFTKNGETRRVPMNQTVRDVLSGFTDRNDNSYIFCKKDGTRYNFRSPFLRAVQKAGIKDFHFHDLRHTAASYLAMAGVDLNTIREILGHKTLGMVLRYAHLSHSHQANAVSALDKHMDTIWTPEGNDPKSSDEEKSCNPLI